MCVFHIFLSGVNMGDEKSPNNKKINESDNNKILIKFLKIKKYKNKIRKKTENTIPKFLFDAVFVFFIIYLPLLIIDNFLKNFIKIYIIKII